MDLAALGGHGDLSPVGDVVAGDGALGFYEVLGGAGVDDFAAAFAGAGADVDHPVGAAYRVLVVFDDDQRVAEIAQVVQGFDEAFVVTLVQADGRLVEHEHGIGLGPADLAGQLQTLGFAAGQGRNRLAELEIIQADFNERLKITHDFLVLFEELNRFSDRHVEHFGDVGLFAVTRQLDLEDLIAVAGAFAFRAA